MTTKAQVFGTMHASGQTVLRASAVTTTSYVATDDVPTLGFNCVRFGRLYDPSGGEVTVQFFAEGYDGTTWHVLTFKAPQASAVAEETPDVLQFTRATINTFDSAARSYATPPFDCRGFQKVRGNVKYAGGSGPGTLGITASFGMDVVGGR